MACEAADILNDLPCLQCAIPAGLVGYVALALMCRIADGNSMSCDPADLVEEARCLQCAIPAGLLGYAQLAKLCDISGGGGGGGGAVMTYTGDDPNTDGIIPTDPTKPALCYKSDGSAATYSWDVNLQIWV